MNIRYCIVSYGGIHWQTAYTMTVAAYVAGKEGIGFLPLRIGEDSIPHRCRSRALGVFMQQTQDEVMVMIDRDMTVDHSQHIITMCKAAIERDAVIGCIASKRGFKMGLCGKRADGKIVNCDDINTGLVEAHLVGTGIMCIPRTVINRCQPKASEYLTVKREVVDINKYDLSIVPITERDDKTGNEFTYYDWFQVFRLQTERGWAVIPEDTAFCMRLRECGEKIYLDTRDGIGHVGEYVFYAKDQL
jgi:hypothetical protein